MDILKKNYFELFVLKVSTQIDLKDLDDKFTLLQKQFHPDKFSNSSDVEKRIALQISSYLNDGYITLRDFISRVEYILKINKFNTDESKTLFDEEFLEEQIELNEWIERLKTDQVESNKASELTLDISNKMEALVKSINDYLSQTKYDMVWNSLAKYKFYRNHLIELEPMIK
tara:strand:+ start:11 stop:526 length:516 start_codon:yes stop_codon:yes gene_type:complete